MLERIQISNQQSEREKHYFSFMFAMQREVVYILRKAMDVRHDDKEVERIESDPEYLGGGDQARAKACRKVLNLIRQAKNEVELYQWKSLRFEKLSGKRQHQRSLRLNDQWRLIVEIEQSESKTVLVVKGVEDYH